MVPQAHAYVNSQISIHQQFSSAFAFSLSPNAAKEGQRTALPFLKS
jgi:hypothetical protein